MLTEQEKYQACYADPVYKMGEVRKKRIIQDIDSIGSESYLDVGCGRGETMDLAEAIGIKPTGIELVPDLCDGERVINAEITAIPFDDGSFDVVSCYDVVEHLPPEEVDAAISELARVTAKRLNLTTNDRKSTFKGMELHLTRQPPEWWREKLLKLFPSVEMDIYFDREVHFTCVK